MELSYFFHQMFKLQQQNQEPSREALTDFSSIPIDSIESLRNKLTQLQSALKKLLEQVSSPSTSYPLYLSIQSQFSVLLSQLVSVSQALEANKEVLFTTNVFPIPIFPTTQQEGLLTTLLRKKPLPEVVDWVESSCVKINENFSDEFGSWCQEALVEQKANFEFWGFQSTEDINNENEKAVKKEEVTAENVKGVKINDILRFCYSGVMPVL